MLKMASSSIPEINIETLRERKPQHAQDASSARDTVRELNTGEEEKKEDERQTFGRTPDGTGR